MRVTQGSMSRNYINNLNNTLLRYNKSMDKVSSGRRFTKCQIQLPMVLGL